MKRPTKIEGMLARVKAAEKEVERSTCAAPVASMSTIEYRPKPIQIGHIALPFELAKRRRRIAELQSAAPPIAIC